MGGCTESHILAMLPDLNEAVCNVVCVVAVRAYIECSCIDQRNISCFFDGLHAVLRSCIDSCVCAHGCRGCCVYSVAFAKRMVHAVVDDLMLDVNYHARMCVALACADT